MHRPSIDTASPSRPTGEPMSPVRGREATVDPDRAIYTGRGGMGNIRSGSRARSASKVPENLPQTASLVSNQAADMAEYERYVIQQNEEAQKARAVRIFEIALDESTLCPPCVSLASLARGPGKGTIPQ